MYAMIEVNMLDLFPGRQRRKKAYKGNENLSQMCERIPNFII